MFPTIPGSWEELLGRNAAECEENGCGIWDCTQHRSVNYLQYSPLKQLYKNQKHEWHRLFVFWTEHLYTSNVGVYCTCRRLQAIELYQNTINILVMFEHIDPRWRRQMRSRCLVPSDSKFPDCQITSTTHWKRMRGAFVKGLANTALYPFDLFLHAYLCIYGLARQ